MQMIEINEFMHRLNSKIKMKKLMRGTWSTPRAIDNIGVCKKHKKYWVIYSKKDGCWDCKKKGM